MVTVGLTGRRLEKYLDAITRAGGQPRIVLPDEDPHAVLDEIGALVLGGGPDVEPARYGQEPHPETYGVEPHVDAFEIELLHAALERELPVLAICRGCQVVNVAFGGTLHQHIPDDPGVPPHGKPGERGERAERTVEVAPGSLVASVLGATTITASCHHHQAVADPGKGLRVVARAADGIVEAIELDDAWLLAVQWHPEDTAATDPRQQALFDAVTARAQPAPKTIH